MWGYNHLCHYGVKGMKWGVRRDKEELDRLAGRAYKVEEHSSYMTIKKGSKFHRVSASNSKDRKGYAYVSYKDEDVKGYRKEISTWLDECQGAGKTFDLTMVAKKDIKVAGEVEKINTFLELLGTEKLDNMSILRVKQNNKSAYSNELAGKPKRLMDALVKQGLNKDVAEYYAIFSMDIYRNQQNKDAFIKALKDKGYDAIVDTEDALAHRMQPIIVFEREKTLKVTKVTELPTPFADDLGKSKEEIEKWQKVYKDGRAADKATKKYHEEKGYDLV